MIKAKDIYNMWIGRDYGIGFEMYLVVKNNDEGKVIEITSNLKKYKDQEFYNLHLTKDINKDIIREDRWFLNLRSRKYSINYIDIYAQFKLEHFELDKDTGKLIFVFSLNKEAI